MLWSLDKWQFLTRVLVTRSATKPVGCTNRLVMLHSVSLHAIMLHVMPLYVPPCNHAHSELRTTMDDICVRMYEALSKKVASRHTEYCRRDEYQVRVTRAWTVLPEGHT